MELSLFTSQLSTVETGRFCTCEKQIPLCKHAEPEKIHSTDNKLRVLNQESE